MISIVIPAYNEENRIIPTLKEVSKFMEGREHEIIVVSDGSKDNTKHNAQALNLPHTRVVEYHPNRGKGYAVRTGMLEAKGDLILFSDADLSTPIEELDTFLEFKDFDVVIGSRALKDSDITKRQAWYRELMGKTFNKIVRLLTVRGIKDTQCGFKLFKKEAAKAIFQKTVINGWSFDVEALILAQKLGYTIKEQPVQWINDEQSKLSPVKDAIKMFLEILKIRWNIIIGVYKTKQ